MIKVEPVSYSGLGALDAWDISCGWTRVRISGHPTQTELERAFRDIVEAAVGMQVAGSVTEEPDFK